MLDYHIWVIIAKNVFMYISGMWSARDKKEGNLTTPQATPPELIKNTYFSTLKDISYIVNIHIVL